MSTTARSGPGDRPALSRCIGIPIEEFAAHHWGRRALLSPALDPDAFSDLFSADAVDELIAERGLRTPFIRMAKEGSVLGPATYTASGGFGAEVADQVSSDRVLAQFAAGATIVLQGLHRMWPPLQHFTRQLIAELGHPAQVNAYVTPGSNRGFDPHYDVHDVFVLQVAGEKRWVVHEPVHENPLADEPWSQHADAVAARAAGDPLIDTVLRPGDALYLPRGYIHSATALGGTTVHLTIGMPAFTGTDIARELVARAVRAPAVRGSLPLGVDVADPAALAAQVRAAADAVIAELSADPDAAARRIAAALGDRFARMTRPEPLRPLAAIEAAEALGPESQVRWRAELRFRVLDEGDRVAIALGERTIRLPGSASEALRQLAEGTPVAVAALPGLDTADALVVVRRLIREGVLVPA
ncbi:MAG: cupin-like domain-containing protein [Micrococcales bacterium]|nr:cupin-like domain-containing protein [Micrococcales bacterium]